MDFGFDLDRDIYSTPIPAQSSPHFPVDRLRQCRRQMMDPRYDRSILSRSARCCNYR